MTDKQRLFITEYLKDLNATQAAIRAGYAESGAREEGRRLLTNADIQKAIQQQIEELIGNTQAIVYKNIQTAMGIRDKETARDSDRLKAAELLGKYAGMFTENINVTTDQPLQVNIKVVDANSEP